MFSIMLNSLDFVMDFYNEWLKCHVPTLSQARDNRRVNPSGVNNTVLELAQGFQTPVYTYNP